MKNERNKGVLYLPLLLSVARVLPERHHLHSLLSEGCATDTEIASLMTHQLEAMNSSLQAWRTALEPLSPRSGELEASGGASATRQMP